MKLNEKNLTKEVREKMGLAKFSVEKTIKNKKPKPGTMYIDMSLGKVLVKQTPN